jgi:uncharacterized membrane protein
LSEDTSQEPAGSAGVNTKWADNRGIQMIALAAGIAIAGSLMAAYNYFSGHWEGAGFYLMVIVWVTTVAVVVRLFWAQRLLRKRRAYWISWTSDAVAPERTTVAAAGLLSILGASAMILPDGPPPMPEALFTVLFGLFLGAPLFEMFVSKPRAWQLFINGEDPD